MGQNDLSSGSDSPDPSYEAFDREEAGSSTWSDDSSSAEDTAKLVGVGKRAWFAACCCLCCGIYALVLLYTYVSWEYWNWMPSTIDHCPVAYDAALMRPIAEASKAAFCLHPHHDGMYNWSCVPCVRSNLTIVDGTFKQIHGSQMGEENRTYGYLMKVSGPEAYAGACLIAFRGTVNTANCMTDVNAFLQVLPQQYACPWCAVHSGFFQAWIAVEDLVVDALRDAGCGSQDGLIITGHSMGAALATLAAWSLTRVHGFELSMFYSFESPRVGNPAFHSAFISEFVLRNRTAFRLTYDVDLVPHIPTALQGFEHVGCEVYYARDGSFKVCRGSPDDSCSSQWLLVQTDANLASGPEGGAHCNTMYAGDMCVCSESHSP